MNDVINNTADPQLLARMKDLERRNFYLKLGLGVGVAAAVGAGAYGAYTNKKMKAYKNYQDNYIAMTLNEQAKLQNKIQESDIKLAQIQQERDLLDNNLRLKNAEYDNRLIVLEQERDKFKKDLTEQYSMNKSITQTYIDLHDKYNQGIEEYNDVLNSARYLRGRILELEQEKLGLQQKLTIEYNQYK